MSAGVGQAGSIGSLSVPPSWTAAAPSAATPTAPGLGSTPLAAPPEVAAGVPGVAPTGAAVGARAGATGGIMDNRFLVRPPMVPSWAAVG
jgi:PPE-repeat protein